MILLFFLLPSLSQAAFLRDHHDCFLAKFRLLCGNEDYKGPLNMALWDNNLLGGDKEIKNQDYFITKGRPMIVRDVRDRSDCWFFEPYILFTSYCKNPSSTPSDPFTLDRFKDRFERLVEHVDPIYTVCHNMPSERAPKSFAEIPETVIQLAEEHADCKNQS